MRDDLIIQISESKTFIGGSEEQYRADAPRLQNYLRTVFEPYDHIKMVNVYNFEGHRERFSSGSDQRLNIYMGVTPEKEVDLSVKKITFADFNVEVQIYGSEAQDGFIDIVDDTGEVVIAKYDTRDNDLYILFNPFYNARRHPLPFTVMQLIVKQMFRKLETPNKYRNSWNKTGDRKKLIETLERIEQKNSNEEIEKKTASLDRIYADIKRNREELRRNIQFANRFEKELEILIERNKKTDNKLVDQVMQIARLDKVDDIELYDHYFVVKVLNIHAETEEGNKHYIGDFEIVINYGDSDIAIINTNNQRRGFWSNNDNHPHVAHSGEACFGNLEETVAELCAQQEFYALVVSLIDFLETVNEDDSAGKYITSWDVVEKKDEEKTEFLESYEEEPVEEEEYVTCDVSGKRILKRKAWTIYWDFDEETLEPKRKRYIDKEHLDSFRYWKSIGAWVNKTYFERKYFDEDGYPYNEMDLVEDHQGYMIPKSLAKRAWGEYSHEEGLSRPVFVYNEELPYKFTNWESLNGEWVDADWAIEEYFFGQPGHAIDDTGRVINITLKPIPDHKVEGVDV